MSLRNRSEVKPGVWYQVPSRKVDGPQWKFAGADDKKKADTSFPIQSENELRRCLFDDSLMNKVEENHKIQQKLGHQLIVTRVTKSELRAHWAKPEEMVNEEFPIYSLVNNSRKGTMRKDDLIQNGEYTFTKGL